MDGERLTALRTGALPVAGPGELAEPVAAGVYTLIVRGPGVTVRRILRVQDKSRTHCAIH